MLEEELKKIIIEKYGSVRQFAIKIDVPYTTVDTILKRGVDNSNVVNVIKMCKELNLSIDKLIDEKQILSNLSFDNATFVDIDTDTVMIPVLGVIKAGVPIEAQEDILEYVDMPREWTKGGKTYYGLKISGDSMYPKYEENDIVIFQQTTGIDYSFNLKDCAVMVNCTECTFKKVIIKENSIILQPYNDTYEPMIYTKEEIENLPINIVGVVRERRIRY